jgi:hypothetical protein
MIAAQATSIGHQSTVVNTMRRANEHRLALIGTMATPVRSIKARRLLSTLRIVGHS